MRSSIENQEARAAARLPHESSIKVKATDGSLFHSGRLVNHSRNGVCFETDLLLKIGTEVFIAVQNSPFDDADDVGHDMLHAVIRHFTQTESHFLYQYGARINGKNSSRSISVPKVPIQPDQTV
jgi:hypothetical protein